jgi:hypothetical protein
MAHEKIWVSLLNSATYRQDLEATLNLGPGLRQVKQGGGGFFLLDVIIYWKTHVSKPLYYHRTSVVGRTLFDVL